MQTIFSSLRELRASFARTPARDDRSWAGRSLARYGPEHSSDRVSAENDVRLDGRRVATWSSLAVFLQFPCSGGLFYCTREFIPPAGETSFAHLSMNAP